jgi:hypothetical protein
MFYGICLYLTLPLMSMLTTDAVKAGNDPDRSISRMRQTVEVLKLELGIPNHVGIKIVESNRRALSVEALNEKRDFVICVDAGFLAQLDDEEITAALSHELGHVWIYTHHPFLHTEQLANQIAMRVTTRDSLKKLYLKLAVFEGGNVRSADLPEPDQLPITAITDRK